MTDTERIKKICKFKFDYNLIDDIEQNNHNKETKRIITLSTQELEQIDKTPMPSTELENTKKWLLLGCELGQRASDLFRIKESDIFTENNIEVIELTQQKTKKRVMIPITPRAREIINTGFPTKIKLVNFNEQIKKVCEIAQINIKIKSYKQNGTNTKTEIIAPKWNFITSHIMRRSFATNYYGIIPTPLIISVTGHSTETVFLNYIGKTPTDNAHAFLQALQKFQKNNPS